MASSMPPDLFVLVILERVPHFSPRLAWTTILFYILTVAGMTGMHPHAQLFPIEMGVPFFFFFLPWLA
jgi:hypothetical protein